LQRYVAFFATQAVIRKVLEKVFKAKRRNGSRLSENANLKNRQCLHTVLVLRPRQGVATCAKSARLNTEKAEKLRVMHGRKATARLNTHGKTHTSD